MKIKFSILALTALFLLGCTPKEFSRIQGETQGTTYHILVEGKHPELKKQIELLLKKFDQSLSVYDPNSLISKVNKGNYIKIDTLFKQMYQESRIVNQKTDGAFDITVAPLINAFGFGFEEVDTEIDSMLIDSILQFVGMDKITLRNDTLIKADPRLQISGNAIAQGQSVDLLCNLLEQKGIKNYMVEVGGELRTHGLKNGQKWRVGIDRPEDGNMTPGEDLQAVLSITDKAVATSGNYRNFYLKDGKKYGHTINPKTGYPAFQNILSATIVADACITADAYATGCMASGLKKSIQIVENNPQLEAYFVYVDKQGEVKTYYSKGIKSMIEEK